MRPLTSATPETLVRTVEPGLPSSVSLVRLTDALLKAAGGPILFETLVEGASLFWGITDNDKLVYSEALTETATDDLTLEEALLRRDVLEEVWREVLLLPPRQCAALLLNLRDSAGRGVLELLLEIRFTDKKTIAHTLQWTETELETLWNDLPIDDNTIATKLGTTRQQVINLRKVARERLGRRLRKQL